MVTESLPDIQTDDGGQSFHVLFSWQAGQRDCIDCDVGILQLPARDLSLHRSGR